MKPFKFIRSWRLDAWIFHGFRPKNHSKIIKNTHSHPPFSSCFDKQKLFFTTSANFRSNWAPGKNNIPFFGESPYNGWISALHIYMGRNSSPKTPSTKQWNTKPDCFENRTDQNWKDPCGIGGGWATLSKNIRQIGSCHQVIEKQLRRRLLSKMFPNYPEKSNKYPPGKLA